MILLIVIGIILFVIGWIMVVPVYFRVDTDDGIYSVYQPASFSVRFFPAVNLIPEVRIVGIRIPVKKTTAKGDEPRKKSVKKSVKKKQRRSVTAWRFLALNAAKAFRVRRFQADVDTDDFALNAKLVPWFYFASRGAYSLNVNFNGRNYLAVLASVRLITLIWAYILFLTKQ